MPNRLSGLPKRAVIDANVLLNAAYLNTSYSAPALKILRQLGVSVLVPHSVLAEAEGIVDRICRKHRISKSIHIRLAQFVRECGLLAAHSNESVNFDKVPMGDRHVFAAASRFKAW